MRRFDDLDANDLDLVKRVLRENPQVGETVQIVKQVSSRAKFPLGTFDDLAGALGGEEAEVSFRGRTFKIDEVRRMIPAYYFPIQSREDLLAKISDLQARIGPGGSPAEQEPSAPVGQQVPIPEGIRRPAAVLPDRPGTGTGAVGQLDDAVLEDARRHGHSL